MWFNLFSRRSVSSADSDQTVPEASAQAERALLSAALFKVLETLPQSFSGRENIRVLCDAIASASSHLRFVWVGFTEGNAERVKPYAFSGPCHLESHDWTLPVDCFDNTGPYSQRRPEPEDGTMAEGLFAPWRRAPSDCSVCCALAAPLRSEKAGLRGMIVFYADKPDYFDDIGLPLMEAFCHVGEIIWKQSNLVHVATQVAQQDPLTALMGRRHTMTVLDKEIARAERTERPLSILMCRIDGLNKLNDMYGLHATDAILAAFAREAGEQLRPGDKGGRWAGTEFIYIMPGTDHDAAESMAVKLGDYFRNRPINVRNWSIRLALRLGTATYTRHSLGLDDLIMQAHQSLAATNDELPTSVL
ncbi:sensor domain-containing diguanylate cyclase [Lacisediminimonas profundi]|uniref:sensor domain-containing diguanylate cyclase n=1 Tax=Lacisediminimonas profundi TaxID=2603856 RepID=UPI00124BAFA1|nr:GGDEF domain-containing protein [Lacisediminimonas profundi]